MTTRNLNRTWREVVWEQYAIDLEADVAFPVCYLIHAPQWKRDIFITIPSKIPYETFRRAVLDFLTAVLRPRKVDPLWENEYISVRPRIKPPIAGELTDFSQVENMPTNSKIHEEARTNDSPEPSKYAPRAPEAP